MALSDGLKGPTGSGPEMASTGPEPSYVSFVTSLGIALLSATPKRPQDEAEEDHEEDEADALPPWTTGSPTVPPLPRSL